MFKRDQDGERPQSLHFPNPSRSFDATRGGVSFWGYDRTFEVTFFIQDVALTKVGQGTGTDEVQCLDAFDSNREQICAAASGVYARHRSTKEPRSFVLTEAEF